MKLFRLSTVQGSRFWITFEPKENDWNAPLGLITATGKCVTTNETLDLHGFGFLPTIGSNIKVSKGALSKGNDDSHPALFETISKVEEFPIELLEKVNDPNKTGS